MMVRSGRKDGDKFFYEGNSYTRITNNSFQLDACLMGTNIKYFLKNLVLVLFLGCWCLRLHSVL